MNRLQAAEQLRRALQLYAETLPEARALEIAAVYPAWESGRAYGADAILSHGENSVGDPQLYRVAQAHTSQTDWAPDATPALYTPMGLTEAGYPVWSAPTGAHDGYNTGDVVDYNGTLYESRIDGNATVPGTDERYWAAYSAA